MGIHVNRSIPNLKIRGNLSTAGGTGESLVRGELVQLAALAPSVNRGGVIATAHLGGDITNSGDHVSAIEIDGEIGTLVVDGTERASGAYSVPVRMSRHQLDLTTLGVDPTSGTS